MSADLLVDNTIRQLTRSSQTGADLGKDWKIAGMCHETDFNGYLGREVSVKNYQF